MGPCRHDAVADSRLSQSWWYRGAGGGTDPGPATSQSTCLYLPVASSQHTSYQAGQTGDTSRDTSPNVSRQAGPVKTVVMMTGSPWTVTRCSCLTTHSHLSTSHGWRIVMSPVGPSDWLTDCSRENYRYFLIPRLYSALSSTITDAGFGGAKLSFVTLEYNWEINWGTDYFLTALLTNSTVKLVLNMNARD